MEHLHNWVFNFNPYTNKWAAIPRELYSEYWNNSDVQGVIRSSSFSTLLEILNKTEGVDIEKKLNVE
jgi:hypothetical protein